MNNNYAPVWAYILYFFLLLIWKDAENELLQFVMLVICVPSGLALIGDIYERMKNS